jgi:hypothetical protein
MARGSDARGRRVKKAREKGSTGMESVREKGCRAPQDVSAGL